MRLASVSADLAAFAGKVNSFALVMWWPLAVMAERWWPSLIAGTADMRSPPVIGSSLRTAC
jgi:hypothetical protein